MNIPETSAAARKKEAPSGEHPNNPSPCQLWSVLEFSRQFPELTVSLVADLKRAEQQRGNRMQIGDAEEEPLEFPPLVALDPRELKAQMQKKQNKDAKAAEEITLFAPGKLPPPEPLSPSADQRQKKRQRWKYYLLPLALLLTLLWLHSKIAPQETSAQVAENVNFQARK